MGVYDFVDDIQIKCTLDPSFKKYKLDDLIELKNGIYIGYEGWFRVRDSKITDIGINVYDKWGSIILLKDILDNYNPINGAIKQCKTKK